MMRKYTLTDIKWDTDGENVDLPTSMRVSADDADDAVDVASDETGFCIPSAGVEEEVGQ